MKKIRTILKKFSVVVLLLIVTGLGNQQVFSDDPPIITIDFLGSSEIYLDSKDRMIRANVVIENYDPTDGHSFMRVTNLSTNETLKDAQINPKFVDEGLWKVQVSHYLAPQVDEQTVLGEYKIEVYSQYGPTVGENFFQILKSSKSELGFQQMGHFVSKDAVKDDVNLDDDSIFPNWVHTIFVWYAEESISDKELLQALQHLIDKKILTVEST